MAMKPDEAAKLQQFVGAILNGAAAFSMKALPLISLYQKAQTEKLDFWELLLTDEAASQQLTQAMERHVAKLPPALFSGLRVVLNARQQVDLRKKQEAEAMATAKAKQQANSRAEMMGSPVSGNRVEDV